MAPEEEEVDLEEDKKEESKDESINDNKEKRASQGGESPWTLWDEDSQEQKSVVDIEMS